jgi:superfamily II DNA or RNA helicase
MSLLDLYSPDFHDEVKSKGREIYRRGMVQILASGPAAVFAKVDDQGVQSTHLKWEAGKGLKYSCSCPYFQGHGDPCRHAWATVLQASAKNLLPDPGKLTGSADRPGSDNRVASQVPDVSPVKGEEELSQSHFSPAWTTPRKAQGGALQRADVVAPTPPAPDPSAWKKQFSKLTQSMVSGSSNGGHGLSPAQAAASVWPSNRRVIYIVDGPGAQGGGKGLAIELAYDSPRRDGQWERPKHLKISREQIAHLPDETDRQIVQMLLGARRGDYGYYGYYDSEAPRRFELPESAYDTLLRLMCQTGRSRFRAAANSDRLDPLEWDPGMAWEFWLEIKTSAGGRYYVLEGSLRRPTWPDPKAGPGTTDEVYSAPSNGDAAEPHDETPFDASAAGAALSAADPGTESSINLAELEARAQPAVQEAPAIERLALTEPALIVRGGLVFRAGKVARLNDFGAYDLLAALRDGTKLAVPLSQRDDLVKTLFGLPRLPRLDLPPALKVSESRPTPKPRLAVKKPPKSSYFSADDRLLGQLTFDYAGQVVSPAEVGQVIFSTVAHETVQPPTAAGGPVETAVAGATDASADAPPEPRASDGAHGPSDEPSPPAGRVLYRDLDREAEYSARLIQLGFREAYDYGYSKTGPTLRLAANKLPKVVGELTREGWFVEAEGKLYRQPGEFKVAVKSGIDWFELHGEVSFGDQSASLPKLLAALRRGENAVRLDDGTFGLLPQEWLKKYAPLAGIGQGEDDHLRFSARQVGFLDALLAGVPEATFDLNFTRVRDELMRFDGIRAMAAPATFQGVLRAYQCEGLGWMEFLRRFNFGGCLADDMGLGKTVQVLALLESRRKAAAGNVMSGDGAGTDGAGTLGVGSVEAGALHRPTLVVAPRSLIFNWKQEAARFTPELRVLDHTQADRVKGSDHFKDYDLVLTTYGTLRRDAGYFKDIEFDYAVLDEAQAIKNASSESAKAARLIRADHRLALSGTPVQNHLGELWSLFEFLNPGMMGSATIFKETTQKSVGNDAATRSALARAMRPFILRRTKEQVAKDLPQKLEQTLFCELGAVQRKAYNELRDHYRASLLERIAKEGMNKAKIQVLEALLRLRQAACHPGLIDKAKSKEGSAKLDTLMEQVSEVLEENHKVLVFSQFTSFLAIVRKRLDAAGTVYEYLDGKTRDRQERVERFQNDPKCKLFLISLKAGGLGLNLTAAEYVFLLDPWWNPAVESQAIDRAHRIGQTRQVFAYRLIAKDTVEEKVLQLQQTKKDLADAIINADNSLIRTLKRDDLELLLS